MSLRRAVVLCAVALLGGASSLLVGCGSGGQKLIPGNSANALQSDLDAVAAAVSAGSCKRSREALNSLRSDYRKLPSTVDRTLRQRLGDGIRQLRDRAAIECQMHTTDTTTTETVDTTTTETTDTTTLETVTSTTPTTTVTTPTTSTPTTTTPPTTTTGTGGTVVPTATVPTPTPEPK